MNDIPSPHDRDLPPGRHQALREHLMREIETGDGAEAAHGTRPPVRPARRLWRRPAFVAPAVAATLTAAVVVGATFTQNAAAPPRPGVDTATGRRGVAPSDESAAKLLERIAEAAGRRTLPAIRDDQFVYTEREDYHWKVDPERSRTTCASTDEGHFFGVRETWWSVDGQHVGLSREHKDNGKVVERSVAKQLRAKNNVNFYREAEDELPTDAGEMYRYLYGLKSAEQPSGEKTADRDAFEKASALLTGQLLPPKVEVALYLALARIPGLTVYEGTEDAVGRTGVSIGMDGTFPRDFGQDRTRHELLFDGRTLAFLAQNAVNLDTPDDDCEVLEAGDLVSSVAILERGVVDRTGQLP
ncbi:CU044_5270 family protein [Streptomyces sp. CA-210063]|uniref:CU044_5270 family protein n=1 Tax=Streptomyces sp. CA-210063 TaxID=2801029 RepID=UPI00214B7E18|nr:CU044_5270 family protein [Streptomyces sp. CA-210063]UUU31684.1 CU044_5270 family protein [Streptomyces sp. CA-210063]